MAILRPPKFELRNMAEWSKWLQEQQIEAGLGNPDYDGYVLSSTDDGTRSWVRPHDRWPAQFRGSSDQSLSTSAVTVDLAVTDYDPGVYYGVFSDAVVVETPGYYKVTYTVYASVDSVAGSADCNVLAYLRKSGTAIDGSYSASYLSEVSTPDASCDGCVVVLLTGGDAVDLQAQLSAAMDVSTVAARCKLIMERVR